VVRDLLGGLEAPLRDAVTLHFYQGLRVDEVAQVLGVPAGTVKSRLSRAYGRLGAALERPLPRHAVRDRAVAPTPGQEGGW
jgi:RNA polymerase sigma-70 factor (ECF subfamily)